MAESGRTPRNAILDKIRDKILRHKEAIRWLLDAERFKQLFNAESWRGDANQDLSEIAEKNYAEAQEAVILSREALDEAKEELEIYDQETLKEAEDT